MAATAWLVTAGKRPERRRGAVPDGIGRTRTGLAWNRSIGPASPGKKWIGTARLGSEAQQRNGWSGHRSNRTGLEAQHWMRMDGSGNDVIGGDRLGSSGSDRQRLDTTGVTRRGKRGQPRHIPAARGL